MAKTKTKHDAYVDEMRIWIRQQEQRRKACETAIGEADKQIAIIREIRRLEQAQMKIINQRINKAERTLGRHIAGREKKRHERAGGKNKSGRSGR